MGGYDPGGGAGGAAAIGQHEIWLDTHAGYGSNGSFIDIPHFTNVTRTTGTSMTLTNATDSGCSILINDAGVYSFAYSSLTPASTIANCGITLNPTGWGGTAITGVPVGIRLCMDGAWPSTASSCGISSSVTLYCAVNDIIRPHADAKVPATVARCAFHATRLT
jgi:hypothetical protein